MLTSSYHGSLWSTYLNRTTVLHNASLFSEKFRRFPFPLPGASTAADASRIPATVDGFAIRDRCREQNRAFYEAHVRPHVDSVLRCRSADLSTTGVGRVWSAQSCKNDSAR